jgi:hypothetical protein
MRTGWLVLAGVALCASVALGAQAFTRHFLLVAPDEATLLGLEELAESGLAEAAEFWGLDPEAVLSQAQAELERLLPLWVSPPDWVTKTDSPRLVIVVGYPDCLALFGGCLYRTIRASAGHLSLYPPLEHDPFPGDLGIEIRLPVGFEPVDLKGLLAEALLSLFLGVDAQPGGVWLPGFGEYTKWGLDPERADWPYRAFGKLAAQELGRKAWEDCLTSPCTVRYPELAATLIAFLAERGQRTGVLPLLKEATPRSVLGQRPDPTSVYRERLGLSPAELAGDWWEWLSGAEVTEAAKVWYTSRKDELAERLFFLAPLLPPEQVDRAWGLLGELPARGTWRSLDVFSSILAEAAAAEPTWELAEELSGYWDALNRQAVAHHAVNAYLSAKVRFDQAREAGDYSGCVEAYLGAVEGIFGQLELLARGETGVPFPDVPDQYYTPHLCLKVTLPVDASGLQNWTEAQFQRVCELWGYDPDELLGEAQAHLHEIIGGAVPVPGWLKASAPPRITVVYCADPGEYCRYARACTRMTVAFPTARLVQVAADSVHEPYPGDLGLEVVLPLKTKLNVLLHELGHVVLKLVVGLENSIPMFWNEGFAEYTALKLDPDLAALPYRAYARLAAGDISPSELLGAILGSNLYDPRLSSQLIAFVVTRWGADSLLELLRSLSTGGDPAAAISGVLGVEVDALLHSWLDWLQEAEVTEAAETWWFAQKAKLSLRLAYLLPLMGSVRYQWAQGMLERLPTRGSWKDLESVYSLLRDPVREVVNRDLVEELLALLPKLDKETGAARAKILRITLRFKEAMGAGDYRACVDLYLQAVEAALGPLPQLPGG